MYRPPFEKLETGNKEELLNIIQQTKTRQAELRYIMEHPNYKLSIKTAQKERIWGITPIHIIIKN